jgi:D-alanine transaminase
MTSIVFLNGSFCPASEAKISAFDHGFLYGDGVYETLLVLQGKIRDFSAHFLRLQNSSNSLGITFPDYANTPEKITTLCEKLLQKNNTQRGRMRITLSRGENHFDFSSCKNPTFFITLSPLPTYPQEFFSAGIAIKTLPFERSYPEVKSINFLASLMGRRSIQQTGEYEGVFITKEGFFREGTVSNIVVVQQTSEKSLFWKAPEKTVLSGTMQSHLEKMLQKNGFIIEEKNFSLRDIKNLQKNSDTTFEVYITNSLFGVLPVASIDGEDVFSGKKEKRFPLFQEYIGSDFLEKI